MKSYETWKGAFMTCEVITNKTCLKGNPLNTVKDLGHSAATYDAAKHRLDMRFEIERRRKGKYIIDIEKNPQLNVKNAEKSLEKFSNL
jgi:hypothetical protein